MPTQKQHKTILILGATSDVAMPLLERLVNTWKESTFYLLARDTDKLQKFKNTAALKNNRIELVSFDLLNAPDLHFYNINFCIVLAGWLPKDDTETAKTMQVNYNGIKTIIDILIDDNKQNLEQIIITGSIAGVRIRNKNKDYGIAKQALHNYAYQLQSKYSAVFQTTLVIPGFIQTKMLDGIKTPKFLTIQPDKLAEKYGRWVDEKPRQVYSQPAWKLISIVLKSIPEFIMKRLNF